MERFVGFHDALVDELVEAAREHAHEEEYHFEGPVTVAMETADGARRGDLDIVAEIVGSGHGVPGSLVLPDGHRIELGDGPSFIGRLPDCIIVLTDPQVSRHHAEIRRTERGILVADLDSMNGTIVNGVRVREWLLNDGDVITVGATSIRYEES